MLSELDRPKPAMSSQEGLLLVRRGQAMDGEGSVWMGASRGSTDSTVVRRVSSARLVYCSVSWLCFERQESPSALCNRTQVSLAATTNHVDAPFLASNPLPLSTRPGRRVLSDPEASMADESDDDLYGDETATQQSKDANKAEDNSSGDEPMDEESGDDDDDEDDSDSVCCLRHCAHSCRAKLTEL